MNPLSIMIIEDEPEVLDSVIQDVEIFEDQFRIESAGSVDEARKVLKMLEENKTDVALFICDHLMPGVTGVDFLVELNDHALYRNSSKMLLTGQAGLPDTVKAVNLGGLDYYLAKPWKSEHLQQVVKTLLTDYVERHVENVLPYMMVLDAERLSEVVRGKKTVTDR